MISYVVPGDTKNKRIQEAGTKHKGQTVKDRPTEERLIDRVTDRLKDVKDAD